MPDCHRVVIVDDSRSIRALIRSALSAHERLTVVGEAESAEEARHVIRQTKPDVITLDAELPGKSGVVFLSELMRFRPMPVVMFSSYMQRGCDLSIEALSLGAVACIEKPTHDRLHATLANLAQMVVIAANSNVAGRMQGPRAVLPQGVPASNPQRAGAFDKVLLVGASTGGVEAIETLLAGFPPMCPPTLITQHMPANFLKSFAHRLDSRFAPQVGLAEDGMRAQPGQVLLAPGGDFHLELLGNADLRLHLREGPKQSGHCPSVDAMFLSAVPQAARCVALLMTGMGRDGAEGMKALRDAGAVTLGQSEATCVVFGMPRAAGMLGGVGEWVPLDRVSAVALDRCAGIAGRGVQQ